ncbi:MAG: hypothetical protein N2446_02320 [Elusimicrobiales bacterium]|nr:hypothetical protein [Elusimicrobiales bacterium]
MELMLFVLNIFVFSQDSYFSSYSGNINYYPNLSNPATFGQIRNLTTSLFYSDLNYDSGFIKKFTSQKFNFFYPLIWQGRNLSSLFSYEKRELNNLDLEIKSAGIGSYHIRDMEDSYIDVGLNFKNLVAKGIKNLSKNMYDLGILIRKNEYLAGFSFENFNGGWGNSDYGISKNMSFGISRFIADYSIGISIYHNSFKDKDSYLFSFSASHLIRTYRYGYFRLASSISNSSKINFLSFGVFYNRDIWEFSFSFSYLLNKPNYLNTSVGLTLYWGRKDIESEYEKIIKREIKYRKDLLEELYRASQREEKLKKNISEISAQTDELKYKIEMIEKELQKERFDKENVIKEKENVLKMLNVIMEKQRKEKEELESIERKRKEEKIKLIQKEFDREMETYRKFKLQNTSKIALINYLKKIISLYQDSGIDISEAITELLRLTKE